MYRLTAISLYCAVIFTGSRGQGDFQCPELMGRYQDPFDCARFYVCAYGTPHHFSCDNGTLYDHDIGVCRHARDVICRTGNQLMMEVFSCPTMNGMFRDITSCGHFYLCANGRHFRLACPPSLQFNGYVCTWKSATSCRIGMDIENEINWKEELKLPENEVEKEEPPMYKMPFEIPNNDVEYESDYYDSAPEEGESEFPRFVDKVKTLDDVEAIQIGLLAPKGKKMSVETTDVSTTSTQKPTSKSTTTSTTTATTTTRKPTTSMSPTNKAKQVTKKVSKLLTKSRPTTSPKHTTFTATTETSTVLLNETTNNTDSTQNTTTTQQSTTAENTTKPTTQPSTKVTATQKTMKAVKYNGAKALMAGNSTSQSPKSQTSGNTSAATTKVTTASKDKTTSPATKTVTTDVTTTDSANVTISHNQTLDNLTMDSNDTNNSTFNVDNTGTNVTTTSTVTPTTNTDKASNLTTVSTKDTTVMSNVTKIQKKVTKSKTTKPTTIKASPMKKEYKSGKLQESIKFRLDSVELKQ